MSFKEQCEALEEACSIQINIAYKLTGAAQ